MHKVVIRMKETQRNHERTAGRRDLSDRMASEAALAAESVVVYAMRCRIAAWRNV